MKDTNYNDEQLAKTAGSVISTLLSTAATTPALNVTSMRYVNPLTPYSELAKSIHDKEGVAGFYKKGVHNGLRRSGACVLPTMMAEFFVESYELPSYMKPVIAASAESMISISLGEISEKSATARSTTVPNYPAAGAAILARNILFSSSVFSNNMIDGFMNKVKESGKFSDIDEEYLRLTANAILKTAFISSTTPLDKIATEFSCGRTLEEIAQKVTNPKALFNGGCGRTLYGLLASYAISEGAKFGKNHQGFVEWFTAPLAERMPDIKAWAQQPSKAFPEQEKNSMMKQQPEAGGSWAESLARTTPHTAEEAAGMGLWS